MVNVGGPSKGCGTCIARKIKCDQERPKCRQCAKSRRSCAGYRDLTDLMFRNETDSTIARSQVDVPCSPVQIESSTMIDLFVNNFACSKFGEVRTNLFWVPQDYDRILKVESVRFGTQAVGMMSVARLQRSAEYARRGRLQYCLALHSLRQNCQDRHDYMAKCMTVLLLGLFEALSAGQISSHRAWRVHLGGMATMLMQCAPADRKLLVVFFRQARSQMILHALQSCTSVEAPFDGDVFIDPKGASPGTYFDAADRLLVRLARIRACCRHAPTKELLLQATALEQDLAAWLAGVPPRWHPSSSSRESQHWWTRRHDVYPSSFVMYAWNKIRAARILIFDLIRAVAFELGESIELTVPVEQHVIEICSTVPARYQPGGQEGSLPVLGTAFCFFWVLEVVGSMRGAPKELTAWTIECFQTMHTLTGLPQPRIIADRLALGYRRPYEQGPGSHG